jgi:hypothetical protein
MQALHTVQLVVKTAGGPAGKVGNAAATGEECKR